MCKRMIRHSLSDAKWRWHIHVPSLAILAFYKIWKLFILVGIATPKIPSHILSWCMDDVVREFASSAMPIISDVWWLKILLKEDIAYDDSGILSKNYNGVCISKMGHVQLDMYHLGQFVQCMTFDILTNTWRALDHSGDLMNLYKGSISQLAARLFNSLPVSIAVDILSHTLCACPDESLVHFLVSLGADVKVAINLNDEELVIKVYHALALKNMPTCRISDLTPYSINEGEYYVANHMLVAATTAQYSYVRSNFTAPLGMTLNLHHTADPVAKLLKYEVSLLGAAAMADDVKMMKLIMSKSNFGPYGRSKYLPYFNDAMYCALSRTSMKAADYLVSIGGTTDYSGNYWEAFSIYECLHTTTAAVFAFNVLGCQPDDYMELDEEVKKFIERLLPSLEATSTTGSP